MRWRRWVPHFVKSGEDPPDHREAWWGPLNVSLRRMGAVVWPTQFSSTLIVAVSLFRVRVVFMAWRKR